MLTTSMRSTRSFARRHVGEIERALGKLDHRAFAFRRRRGGGGAGWRAVARGTAHATAASPNEGSAEICTVCLVAAYTRGCT